MLSQARALVVTPDVTIDFIRRRDVHVRLLTDQRTRAREAELNHYRA